MGAYIARVCDLSGLLYDSFFLVVSSRFSMFLTTLPNIILQQSINFPYVNIRTQFPPFERLFLEIKLKSISDDKVNYFIYAPEKCICHPISINFTNDNIDI